MQPGDDSVRPLVILHPLFEGFVLLEHSLFHDLILRSAFPYDFFAGQADQYVLRLDVSVDDAALAMQEVEAY